MVDDRRSVSYPNEYFDVNIKGTATLLDVLGKSGKIKRVIQTSTRSVFGEVENQNTKLDEFSINKRTFDKFEEFKKLFKTKIIPKASKYFICYYGN